MTHEEQKELNRKRAHKFYTESREKYNRIIMRYWAKRVLSLSPQELAELIAK